MGLLVRAVEEAGIPTTSTSSARDLTALVRPPRAVFVNYPLGHQTGKPFDRADQRGICRAALDLLTSATEPGLLVDLPNTWLPNGDDRWEGEVQAS